MGSIMDYLFCVEKDWFNVRIYVVLWVDEWFSFLVMGLEGEILENWGYRDLDKRYVDGVMEVGIKYKGVCFIC